MAAAAEEVRAQLDRLLASNGFATSHRLRRFLRFIVERTLEGGGDQLKEYAVGIEVFDRGDQYDPRIDSIVRVEAGRLRAKLDEYYRGQGAADPLIVRIPRGSYIPVFERRTAAPADVASEDPRARPPSPAGRRALLAVAATPMALLVVLAWWLRVEPARGGPSAASVAVLPFADYSTDPADALLAERISDGVRGELVRSAHVSVVSRTSSLQFGGTTQSLREVARALNADMVVEASVILEGDRVRVQARIVDPLVDRKISVHEFEGARADLDRLQRAVAEAISAAARRPPSR